MLQSHVWVATKKNLSQSETITLGIWEELEEAQEHFSVIRKWRKSDKQTWHLFLSDRQEIIFLRRFEIQGQDVSRKLALYEKHKASIDLAEYVEASKKVRNLETDWEKLESKPQ